MPSVTEEAPHQPVTIVCTPLVTAPETLSIGATRITPALLGNRSAELASREESRAIIATAYREDYLGALRRLSRRRDPRTYVRMLDRAHAFTSRLPLDDLDRLLVVLDDCNAFDDTGRRVLKLPPP